MRVRSLAGRLLILQLTVVAVTVAAGALITVLVARERTETAARNRSLTIARTVAALPEILTALRANDPSRALEPLAERLRHVAGVDFITIMRPDGIRYTHPNPSLIGKRFVGTYAPAARGRTVVETTRGTLGRSVRAVVPVRENGRIVALVGVGVLTAAIRDQVAALLPGLLALAALILAVGTLLSLLLARRLKRQTLGLEPQEIATLYAHHDATLHRCARASWSAAFSITEARMSLTSFLASATEVSADDKAVTSAAVRRGSRSRARHARRSTSTTRSEALGPRGGFCSRRF